METTGTDSLPNKLSPVFDPAQIQRSGTFNGRIVSSPGAEEMREHHNDPDDPRLSHCVMTSSGSCHWPLVTDAGFKFVLFQV